MGFFLMALNFLQNLIDRGKNAKYESTHIDDFDYILMKNDVDLDRADLRGDGGDINSSNELDSDQSNTLIVMMT